MPARAHEKCLKTAGASPAVDDFRTKTPSAFKALQYKIGEIEREIEELHLLVRETRQQTLTEIHATRLLFREDAATLLALSISQLDRLTKDGQIPVTYLDSRPRYSLSDLKEFRQARTQYSKIRGPYRTKNSSPANRKNVQQEFPNHPNRRGRSEP